MTPSPARAAQATIDLTALRHNLARARALAPGSRVMAIIKADAYGHGVLPVARALGAADAFGVACLDEALALRAAGMAGPITLLEGFHQVCELPRIAQHGLDVVVHDEGQLDGLERHPVQPAIRVWLKLDTGMHRLGLQPERLAQAWQRLDACPWVAKPLRLMTHLACADERAHPLNLCQWQCFQSAAQRFAGERSLANSAALLAWPETHAEWVRPGIMLYGISPFAGSSGVQQGLRPVMTLRSRLMSLRPCRQGEAVGYGAGWTCPADTTLGIVAIGYGDGYPRHVAAGTPVLVNGRRVPLVGRVSMDMLYVDLGSQPEARIGDPVVLWGEGLPVEEIARCAGTIAYELVCQVTQRVPRVCVDAQAGARPQDLYGT